MSSWPITAMALGIEKWAVVIVAKGIECFSFSRFRSFLDRISVMLTQKWSNTIRNWLFRITQKPSVSRSTMRRRSRNASHLKTEMLESRLLLSAVSINDVGIIEGDSGTSLAVFTISLSAPSAQTVTVAAASADGTATSPTDYLQLSPTTVTFAPGETSKTISVTVNGDTNVELNETFVVNLTNVVNATIADGQGTGTIINDDSAPPVLPPPTLSINDVAILEGNAGSTSAVFTVTLSSASVQPVTVVATSVDGTATSPSDFIHLPSTTLTFTPGETTKIVTVLLNGDVTVEPNETFFVELSSPVGAVISDKEGMGTIVNDDNVPPTVPAPTLSIGDVSLLEGNVGTTNAVFTVTLSAASTQIVTVLASSADGTAATPLDYVALPPTVITFAPGEMTKTVTVTVIGDAVVEANETFVVNLTTPVNATVSDDAATGTIINDDSGAPTTLPPTLSIGDVAVIEGNAGTSNAVFTITLSAPSTQPVTVLAASADGTATTPSDYIVLPPTLVTFAPGVTTMTVTVPVNGDATVEADETFLVNLTAPINATVADIQAVGTILNDDSAPPVLPPPTLSISDVAVLEGSAGTTNAVFTVTLSAASALPVTVLASSADGTATAPSDYILLPPTLLTFAPGITTMTVTVLVNGDATVEPDETFVVNLTTPTNATLSDNQGLGTIVNDDGSLPVLPPPTVSINDLSILEGDAGTTTAVFTITLSQASNQTVTVLATSADGTATTPSDYTLLPPTLVTFAPGETTKTVTVSINGDATVEPDEDFVINLSVPTNATIADNQGVGTILNDDPTAPVLPPATLSINDIAVVEGNAGTTNAVFTVTLSSASAQTVTVVVSSADGTASTPSDYLLLPPTILTFAPGETTKTVTVAVNGDVLVESDETFLVNLTAPMNATLADAQGVGTIVNDDGAAPVLPPPTLSVNDVTLSEGNAGVTNAVFTITLSAPSAQAVTVMASSANGTATTPSDYILLPPTLVTFAPGETTKTVSVAVNGDTVSEANETFFVNLTTPVNATIADNQGVGTITNDDTSNVSIVKIADGAESNTPTNGKFRVSLSNSSSTDTVVNYTVSGTATAGADYSTLSGTVTIPAGQTTADIDVNVLNDSVIEDTETVIITVSGFGAHGAAVVLDPTPSNLTATVRITDDDPLIITSPATASVPENTPATTVVLDVNATPVSGHTFTYSLSGPDAAAFTLNPATGEIRFAVSPDADAPIDQGANNVYNVTIKVTADFTPTRSTSQDLTITVTPLNDMTPVFTDSSPAFSVPENSPVGTIVGSVAATDGDTPSDTLTYFIVSGNESGAFTIDPATGTITVADSAPLNFEATHSFTLDVRVTDNGIPAHSADATVVVNVTDVLEGPTITIASPQGTFQLGRAKGLVAPDATFTYDDVANPSFANAKLTVSIVAGRARSDHLKIEKKGNGESQISTKGRKVLFNGTQIGTLIGGRGRAHPELVVSFNSNATTQSVDSLLRRLNFHARTDVGTTRTVHLQITNVGGADSNVATRDILVVDNR
jgi:hypothetical protein